MKMILVLLSLVLMLSFIACEPNKNIQQSNTSTLYTKVPTDGQILNSIRERGINIVGRLKVSENVYNIYYAQGGEISYRPYELIQLENGNWLINNPGYYIRRINWYHKSYEEIIKNENVFLSDAEELLIKVNDYFNNKRYEKIREIYIKPDGNKFDDNEWFSLTNGFDNWILQAGKIKSSHDKSINDNYGSF